MIDKSLRNLEIEKILSFNEYNEIVPYNIWFENSDYNITYYTHNGKILRTRYYKNEIITPLISQDNRFFNNYEKFALYQPFFPENFYSMWEILHCKHSDLFYKKFLNISTKRSLGGVEAMIIHSEKAYDNYRQCLFDVYLSGSEKYDYVYSKFIPVQIDNNCLNQTYNVNFIDSISNDTIYDIIHIDTIKLLKYYWKIDEQNEEISRIAYYLIKSYDKLSENGKIILKLNHLFEQKNLKIIFGLINVLFKTYVFYRPLNLNPLNGDFYVIMNTKIYNYQEDIYHLKYSENIFKYQLYKIGFNNQHMIKHSTQICKQYMSEYYCWKVVVSNLTSKKDTSNNYYLEFNLFIIDDIHTTHINNSIIRIHLSYDATECNINVNKNNILNLLCNDKYQELINSKMMLNHIKRSMDTKPSNVNGHKENYFYSWENLSNTLHNYSHIKKILIATYKAEIVTNAWMKMYEILNLSPDLISKKTTKSFHICEAPGAFISALNHYLGGQLEWYAQTLCPNSNKLALSDHYGLIKKYPERWLFSNKNTGDITDPDVIKSYSKNKLLEKIDLITADGGLFCDIKDLNYQEEILSKIVLGQIVCILCCLSKKGNALLKLFLPLSEPLTISLLYILSFSFQDIIFIKPPSSNPNNSEIYIIMKNYKGIDAKILSSLFRLMKNSNFSSKISLFSEKRIRGFLEKYVPIISQIIENQILSLATSYSCYYDQKHIKKTNNLNDWTTINKISVNQVSIYDY
jgi:hypothetical protein